MKILKWYSPIILTIAVILVLIDAVLNSDSVALTAFAIYIPVVWYLWVIALDY